LFYIEGKDGAQRLMENYTLEEQVTRQHVSTQEILLLPCPITLGVADCNFTPLSTLANRYYYQHKPSQRRLLESKRVVW
jgi:hypothetical protein